MRWKPDSLWALPSGMAVGLALGLLFGVEKSLLTGSACAQLGTELTSLRLNTGAACLEFWLNRYQTLLTGLAAVLVGFLLHVRSVDKWQWPNAIRTICSE